MLLFDNTGGGTQGVPEVGVTMVHDPAPAAPVLPENTGINIPAGPVRYVVDNNAATTPWPYKMRTKTVKATLGDWYICGEAEEDTAWGWHDCEAATARRPKWKMTASWAADDCDTTYATTGDNWVTAIRYAQERVTAVIERQMAAEMTAGWTADWTVRYGNGCSSTQYYQYTPPDPNDRLREIIRERMAPAVVGKRGLKKPEDIREERARETLCRVIGLRNFQDYVKKGFVVIQGKSGLRYQIFPGHGITNVYRQGEMVERLCVVLRGDFPPTDSLIMRYLLILNDEDKFRGYAIKHQVLQRNAKPVTVQGPPPSLTEVFRTLRPHFGVRKRAAAVA